MPAPNLIAHNPVADTLVPVHTAENNNNTTTAATTPAAFAASPPPTTASPTTAVPLSPTIPSPRLCEGCSTAHSGSYGSGRFCSATCAKKVGAKHKWAARAAPNSRRTNPARRALPDAPCEACAKLHDGSYGSGRFCSVHCARRVAATRKWEKSRADKSKRLEAIRPAMLAPPPTPPTPSAAGPAAHMTHHHHHHHQHHHQPTASVAGKRRRVVARGVQNLAMSDSASQPSFYVTGASYAVPPPTLAQQQHQPAHSSHIAQPIPMNTTTASAPMQPPAGIHATHASSPALPTPAPHAAAYLPPAPALPLRYGAHHPIHHPNLDSNPSHNSVPSILYATHSLSPSPSHATHPHQTSNTTANPHHRVFYGHPLHPPYRLLHPATTAAALDSPAAYSVMSQSPSPPPLALHATTTHHQQQQPQQQQPLAYAPANYQPLSRPNPAFEMDAVTPSPTALDDSNTHTVDTAAFAGAATAHHVAGLTSTITMGMRVAPPIIAPSHAVSVRDRPPNVEGSEAARALLCLRATNS